MNFLITTHHNRLTRHERIKQELQDWDYIPILAPDWKMFKHTDLNPKQYKQQSLTLAYYQACQTAVFMEVDYFTIVEDDIEFTSVTPLGCDGPPPEGWDLIFATRTNHNQESAETEDINHVDYDRVISNWWETPFTRWSISFANEFIDHIEAKLEQGLWLGHVDHELMKLCETGKYKFYGSKHKTAIGLSNTDQDVMDKAGSINLDVI